MPERPQCESRSQSLRNVLEQFAAWGNAARVLPGVLGEVIEEFVGHAAASAAATQDLIGFAHRGAGLDVRNLALERQALFGRDPRQQDAHGVGDGRPHGAERPGGSGLDLLVHAHVDHGVLDIVGISRVRYIASQTLRSAKAGHPTPGTDRDGDRGGRSGSQAARWKGKGLPWSLVCLR